MERGYGGRQKINEMNRRLKSLKINGNGYPLIMRKKRNLSIKTILIINYNKKYHSVRLHKTTGTLNVGTEEH